MIRLGLVGCGFIGTVHAWALASVARLGLVDARLAAAFDADHGRAERLTSWAGGEPVDALGPLLDACDAVLVCTWTAGHLEIVRAAAERGLPVFCEKPLAPSLAECERVAAELRRVPHQVGLVLRHAPVFAHMKEGLGSGRYGRPMTIVLRDDQYFPNQGQYASVWRADVSAAGGGTLIEHSIHDVDVLLWLFGRPEAVTARRASFFGHPGIEDLGAVMLSYADGRVATLVSVWHQVLSRPSTRRIEVFCEDAVVWSDDDYLGPLHVETTEGESVVETAPPAWASELLVPDESLRLAGALYAEQMKAFVDALEGRREPWPDADVALAAHRVVDAAYRSASAGGGPVTLGDVRAG